MTKLYGGAIKSDLPEVAVDVSDFREVPDTQEVYILERPDGLDRSIIFDLLEMVKANTLPEIISIHLEDILEGPPTFLAPIESSKTEKGDFDVHYFFLKPPPSKQETEETKLYMFLCLIRLENVATDVLLTFNIPSKTGEVSSELLQKVIEDIMAGSGDFGECFKQLKHWVSTFEVADWGLFK